MEKMGVTMMKAVTVEVVAKIMEQPGGDEGSGLRGSKIGGDENCAGGSDSEGDTHWWWKHESGVEVENQ